MTPELKTRLLKLLALSKHGKGGEQKNAEEFLRRMLEKNNISMAEIDDGSIEKRNVVFKYRSSLERRLFCQIIFCVCGADGNVYKGYGQSLMVELTPSEEAEVVVMYSLLRKALRKEIGVFFTAFVEANKIYPDASRIGKLADRKYTREEEEERMRAAHMAQGIKRTHIRKQITGAA